MKTNKLSTRLFLIGLFSVLTLSGCVDKESKARAEEEEDKKMEELYTLREDRDEMVKSMQDAFAEIDANLEAIRIKEAALRKYGPDEEVPGDTKDRIVRDIRTINALMDDNRKKIENLQARLGQTALKAADFEKRSANAELHNQELVDQMGTLNKLLQQKDTELEVLNADIVEVTRQLLTVNEMNKLQSDRIDVQEEELNTVYYLTGSSQELKASGVLVSEGGIFHTVAAGSKLSSEPNREVFVKADKRMQTLIPLFARKGKLITPHPAGSYEWVEHGKDGEVLLKITNPDEFWRVSKYLVVQTVQ